MQRSAVDCLVNIAQVDRVFLGSADLHRCDYVEYLLWYLYLFHIFPPRPIWASGSCATDTFNRRPVQMASRPLSPQPDKQSHGIPYCSDPDCHYCKDLREVQEALRLHEPIPIKKSG
jgi:hypothetical protein